MSVPHDKRNNRFRGEFLSAGSSGPGGGIKFGCSQSSNCAAQDVHDATRQDVGESEKKCPGYRVIGLMQLLCENAGRKDRAVVTPVPDANMAMVILARLDLLTLEEVTCGNVEPAGTCLHRRRRESNPYCRSRLVDTRNARALGRLPLQKAMLFASAE